jgi:hypothetical protein
VIRSDLAGGHIGARLDAAVALFEGGLGDEFGAGAVAKIIGDLGFEIRRQVAWRGRPSDTPWDGGYQRV